MSYLKPELVFHQWWKEATFQYQIRKNQKTNSIKIVPDESAMTRLVREVEIPLANNVTNKIHRQDIGG